MKVYVLLSCQEYEGDNLVGVFSTEELAKAHPSVKGVKWDGLYTHAYRGAYFEIRVWNLDGEEA